MFIAPVLYFIHALLTGLSLFIAASMHWTAGFGFSAGLIDYFLSLKNPNANEPLMLLALGAVYFVLYYFIFRFVIKWLDIKTPGRESDDEIEAMNRDEEIRNNDLPNTTHKYNHLAEEIINGVGGKKI